MQTTVRCWCTVMAVVVVVAAVVVVEEEEAPANSANLVPGGTMYKIPLWPMRLSHLFTLAPIFNAVEHQEQTHAEKNKKRNVNYKHLLLE